MNDELDRHQKRHLADLAVDAMRARGLAPEFSADVRRQVAAIEAAADAPVADDGRDVRDLTALPWCSIDNDDSRDLDHLTGVESLPNAEVRLLVAVSDVDLHVTKGSAVDRHAAINTTSVYTSARIFPMLPERLCTDLTSLNPGVDRRALVTAIVFTPDGRETHSEIFRARVRNQAQLAYDAVSDWIVGHGPLPAAADAVPGLDARIRLQDALAQTLRERRHARGALEFQTFQPRAEFDGERIVTIRQQPQNRGRQLIEEFMIATNGVAARFLAGKRRASIRRVVRSPERWLRIVALAAEYGTALPPEPDSVALERFLAAQRRRDPLRFPDLSLVVIKLMGSGEYVVQAPRGPQLGHFGLAVRDYTHSTAPNRRYPDLVTSRLLKAALADVPAPYSDAELAALATHCTRQEDAADKVERQLRKSEAAMLLGGRIGEVFDGVVTGTGDGNAWLRILAPPAEGKLLTGRPPRVGHRLRARLVATDVERGWIDFEPA